MFIVLKISTFNHLTTVENHLKDVDNTWFLRIQSIDMYCYK